MKNKKTALILVVTFLFILVAFVACTKGGLEPIVVTDEHGQPVTDEHGEVITVIPVTQVIVITNASGEEVTDENGNVVTTIEYESQTVGIPVTDDKGNVVGTTNIHVPMPDDPPPTTAVIIPPSSVTPTTPNYVKYEKSFGGSGEDEINYIEATPDGGFITAVNTSSLDGDIPVSEGFFGKLAVLCKYDSNGNLQWKKALGGYGNTSINGIHIDKSGNIFVVGSTKDTRNFAVIGTEYDGYIQKYDVSGNLAFTSVWGGTATDFFYDISTDSNGNIYAVGSSYSQDGDAATLNIARGDSKAIVVKFDSKGTVSSKIGLGAFNDYFNKIEINNSNEIFVSGIFSSKTDNSLFQNKGKADVGIVKLSTSLTQEWAKSWGGSDVDTVMDIAVTSDGGVVGIGYTKSKDGNLSGISNKGGFDAFIVKWTGSGSIAWYDTCAGEKNDSFTDVFVDTDGAIYISGYSESTLRDFKLLGNLGKNDAFVVKYSAAGSNISIRGLGGTKDDAFYGLCKVTDGNFVGVGYSLSNDRDFHTLPNPSDGTKKKGIVVKFTMD